ncbi:MAG: hypothetical protein HYZ83_05035, partial [Candidatus Omnitrophica bacterium]|nr:hypothetical protein [Candidatus Omnitrophota bacterium]
MRVLTCAFKKVIAVFVAVSMFFHGYTAYAIAEESPAAAINSSTKPIPILDFRLPAEIGDIKEKFEGRDGRMVFIIQDAHAVPNAQRNIQKIIDYVQTKYGVNMVVLEG